MDEAPIEVQPESRIKKQIERSAAYPALPIEDSLKYVAEMYKHFRNSYTKREDISALVENSHPRNIAASVYYLFLNREKDSYQVSDLYKTVANPISEVEKRKCLLQAFAAPKLNSELIDKFDGDEIPKELIIHLSRFHKITEDAAPLAAEVFIKNARFCGVLGDDNILNYKKTLEKLNDSGIQFAEVTTEQEIKSAVPATPPIIIQEHQKPPSNNDKPPQQNNLLLEEIVNKEEVKIRLTGNKIAYLIYPNNITKKDVAILQKQIEQLDLIVE